MGVPVLRGGRVVGVLVLQNRSNRNYTNDEIEAIQERIAREHGLRLVDHRHELYGVPIEEA